MEGLGSISCEVEIPSLSVVSIGSEVTFFSADIGRPVLGNPTPIQVILFELGIFDGSADIRIELCR